MTIPLLPSIEALVPRADQISSKIDGKHRSSYLVLLLLRYKISDKDPLVQLAA